MQFVKLVELICCRGREGALDRFRAAGMFAVLNARSASDRLLRGGEGLLPCSFFGRERSEFPARTGSFPLPDDGMKIEVGS